MQKPFCQGFPLFLPKLLTQVNQLCLSIWSICCELSHIGAPWGCLLWAIGCSCFTFCCTTGLTAKWRPAVSERSSPLSLTASLSEMLGSPGPWGSCSNANTLLPIIFARCTLVWHHGEHSPCSPSRQPGRSTAWCQWQSVPLAQQTGTHRLVRLFSAVQ